MQTAQPAHDHQRHRVVVDAAQRRLLHHDRHQADQGGDRGHEDRPQPLAAAAQHGLGAVHAAAPVLVDVLEHDDAVVDHDADQQQQPDRRRLVEVGAGQVEGPDGAGQGEGQRDHQGEGLAHRLEQPRHHREDQQQGQQQVGQELLRLLLLPLLPVAEGPGVAVGEVHARQGRLDLRACSPRGCPPRSGRSPRRWSGGCRAGSARGRAAGSKSATEARGTFSPVAGAAAAGSAAGPGSRSRCSSRVRRISRSPSGGAEARQPPAAVGQADHLRPAGPGSRRSGAARSRSGSTCSSCWASAVAGLHVDQAGDGLEPRDGLLGQAAQHLGVLADDLEGDALARRRGCASPGRSPGPRA